MQLGYWNSFLRSIFACDYIGMRAEKLFRKKGGDMRRNGGIKVGRGPENPPPSMILLKGNSGYFYDQ